MAKKNKSDAPPEDEFDRLWHAYQQVFTTEAGEAVLQDLRDRHFFYDTTVDDNPFITHKNEGQRSVVMHIENMLKITPEQLRAIGQAKGHEVEEEY